MSNIIDDIEETLVNEGHFHANFARGIGYWLVSATLGPKIVIRGLPGHGTTRPNIFLTLSAPPRIFHKSTIITDVALRMFDNIVREVPMYSTEEDEHSEHTFTGGSKEGITKSIAENNISRTHFTFDEFGRLVKYAGNSKNYTFEMLGTLTSLYGGSLIDEAYTSGNRVIKSGVYTTLISGMQRLEDYFDANIIKSGFIRRFILVCLTEDDLDPENPLPPYNQDQNIQLQQSMDNIASQIARYRSQLEYVNSFDHAAPTNRPDIVCYIPQNILDTIHDIDEKQIKLILDRHKQGDNISQYATISMSDILVKLTALEALASFDFIYNEAQDDIKELNLSIEHLKKAQKYLDKIVPNWEKEIQTILEPKEQVKSVQISQHIKVIDFIKEEMQKQQYQYVEYSSIIRRFPIVNVSVMLQQLVSMGKLIGVKWKQTGKKPGRGFSLPEYYELFEMKAKENVESGLWEYGKVYDGDLHRSGFFV